MILAIANQKGGTAKSTTAAALAQGAASTGKKALAIDLDPQGNLSYFLNADTSKPGSYQVLTETTAAANAIQTVQDGVFVIPASRDLAAVTSGKGSARRLQDALKPVKERFDLIVIDTPPTIGELQFNALQAADGLLIPLQADIVSLHGLYQVMETVEQIKASNPRLTVRGIILTRHNGRTVIARQMTQSITDKASESGIPFLGIIRESVAVRETQSLQRSLYEYAPQSAPARDYLHVLKKVMEG